MAMVSMELIYDPTGLPLAKNDVVSDPRLEITNKLTRRVLLQSGWTQFRLGWALGDSDPNFQPMEMYSLDGGVTFLNMRAANSLGTTLSSTANFVHRVNVWGPLPQAVLDAASWMFAVGYHSLSNGAVNLVHLAANFREEP